MDYWKFLFSGGLASLLLGSILIMMVLHRFLPFLISSKKISLRDQHQDSTPRFGGVALSWSFWIVLMLFIWLPFETRGIGIEALSLDRKGDKAFFIYAFAKSDLGNIRDDEQEQFKKAAKLILALSDDQFVS